MCKNRPLIITVLSSSMLSFVTIGQTSIDSGMYLDADTSIGHDDNIYRVTDELAQSDSYLNFKPELGIVGKTGKHRFELSYDGDYSKFRDAEDADYYDHTLIGKADFEHSLRFGTHVDVELRKDHEEPGSVNRIQLDINEYNKFDYQSYGLGFSYGRLDSIGRFGLTYSYKEKDYTNNNLDGFDFTQDQFVGNFAYRVAPNTRLYFEAVFSDFDYTELNGFELDSIYQRYRVGVKWELSGKVTGDLSVGYQNRDYDLDSIRDIDGLAYDGKLTWDVNTFSQLSMIAKREAIDTSLEETGGFLRTTYGLAGSHELTERLKIEADVVYIDDELVFTESRKDKRLAYKLGLSYELRKYLDIGAQFVSEDRDSTVEEAKYHANIFELTLSVALEN